MFTRLLAVALGVSLAAVLFAQDPAPPLKLDPVPKPLKSDSAVKVDYDIVHVRAPRVLKIAAGKDIPTAWPEFGHPTRIDPGYDLMLLKPDGTEQVLVPGGTGAVTDPFVSLDGESVYYSYHHNPKAGEWAAGADIYKVHVKTKKITRLTHQVHTPNTGVADWAKGYRTAEKGKANLPYGVYNLGPCPLPDGKIVFTSNRDAVKTPRGYPQYALQLFVMDEDGTNVEKIGHLNVAGALHPVVLTDGRILFSTLESQGLHGGIAWGMWTIHPDGTNWEPIISAFHDANGFHFHTQLSDGNMVIENYYNQNNRGFGTHVKLPLKAPEGTPAFGQARSLAKGADPKMRMLFSNRWGEHRLPFQPYGMEMITRFATWEDRAASLSDPKDPKSPRVGKVTHPSGAPDNHLLTVWSGGATPNANGPVRADIHAGIYLIKDGKPIDEPAQMLRIKHDADYNAQWPRALVSYKRIYGIDEPKRLATLANNGKQSPHLPEGTPFGLVGSSSLYKRESYPGGIIPKGSVTATYRDKDINHMLAAFTEVNGFGNWGNQGADAGLYDNSDIHAIRILAMEPATSPVANKFYNFAHERLRILGEIPVRKFGADGKQPLDPDNNPDTSFLAKIPADVAFTFQTLDKNGMVLNMAQTWHQVRPGEVRTNCGGCHAHSQQPTLFEKTAASRPEYTIFDLTKSTPLITDKTSDQSKRQWDVKDETGVRYVAGVKDVEYWRDVRSILDRSCVACHTAKGGKEPAGELDLDADDESVAVSAHGFPGKPPGTYFRLAMDDGRRSQSHHQPLYGKKPEHYWRGFLASRYVARFQSRRSVLIWQIYGKRLDGLPEGLAMNNKHIKEQLMVDFKPSIMPPPEAVKAGKVKPLTDEDKRTLVRWIDLGCPIDLDYKAQGQPSLGFGWMLDDQRPTLSLTYPQPGANAKLDRILIGMQDYGTGLDMKTFTVTADFAIDGVKPGENLAARFKGKSEGVHELQLATPIKSLERGTLTVAVRDRQGNVTRIERTISITK
ncbi:MAG: hypothetical protein EXR98_06600 [Gemmataceae bacterium]|nr:hypothetical protein [Gemmataceae bacterium]